MITCLQIHNDYLIPGGETKSAYLIANLLENNGIHVIRYYRNNHEFEQSIQKKVVAGIQSIYNSQVYSEIEKILAENKVDFALVHNTSPIISNSIYAVLAKHNVKIIKYLQNYNMLCLNGALDRDKKCELCQKKRWIGVKNACYKNSCVYSFQKAICLSMLRRRYINHIDAYVAISEFVKKKHADNGIDSTKIKVIYHFCDNLPLPESKQENYFLYMGRLSAEKGIKTMLEVFKLRPKSRLVIMGKGNLEEEIRGFVEQENLSNIEMIGYKEGAERDRIIHSARALVVPSEWDEPFGRIVIEAYQLGTPVIVSNRGGLPELISQATGICFEGGNAVSLMLAVDAFESLSSEQYSSMRKAVKSKIDNDFSQKAFYSRFCELLDSIGVEVYRQN